MIQFLTDGGTFFAVVFAAGVVTLLLALVVSESLPFIFAVREAAKTIRSQHRAEKKK
jgi:hypothetical protein